MMGGSVSFFCIEFGLASLVLAVDDLEEQVEETRGVVWIRKKIVAERDKK